MDQDYGFFICDQFLGVSTFSYSPSSMHKLRRNPDATTGFQLAIGVLLGIIYGVFHTYILKNFAFDDIDHKAWLYPKIFLEIILLRVVSPIYQLYTQRELRHFIQQGY